MLTPAVVRERPEEHESQADSPCTVASGPGTLPALPFGMPRPLPIRPAFFLLLCAHTVGCGDSANISGSSEPVSGALDGMQVQLSRRSTTCGQSSFASLVARVDGDMEFPSEALKSLAPPCEAAVQPAVEVYLASDSLLLDFRQVEAPGKFPEASFDGYTLDFERACGDPVIAAATIDATASSIHLGSHRLESGFDRIEINLSGVAYDAQSLLKIDLDIASVRCTNR